MIKQKHSGEQKWHREVEKVKMERKDRGCMKRRVAYRGCWH